MVRLFQAADERAAALYPEADRSGPGLETLLRQRARFFVARIGGSARGCGGFVVLEDGTAELKRFFLDPAARGQGTGRALLEATENAAAAEGVEVMRLETGVRSHEALRLYTSAGYRRCKPFGPYGVDPLSVFMEKRLA